MEKIKEKQEKDEEKKSFLLQLGGYFSIQLFASVVQIEKMKDSKFCDWHF